MQKNSVIVLLILIMAFIVSGCGNPKNNTPVEGAKVFVKAMVESDAELMKYINHSDIFYPAQYCMQIATEKNWAQYDLDQFEYKDLGKGKVEVIYSGNEVATLEMVKENNNWFFVNM